MTLSQLQQEAREIFKRNRLSDYGLDSLIAQAYSAGKDAAVAYIESAFSETRPKSELNISELFREARNL